MVRGVSRRCVMAALAIALLSGCPQHFAESPRILPDRYAGALPVADAYPDELDVALSAWQEQHGPTRCDPGRVQTVTLTEEPRCPSPDGCLMIHYSVLLEERYTVVVLDGADASAVVPRELATWLERCDEGAEGGA